MIRTLQEAFEILKESDSTTPYSYFTSNELQEIKDAVYDHIADKLKNSSITFDDINVRDTDDSIEIIDDKVNLAVDMTLSMDDEIADEVDYSSEDGLLISDISNVYDINQLENSDDVNTFNDAIFDDKAIDTTNFTIIFRGNQRFSCEDYEITDIEDYSSHRDAYSDGDPGLAYRGYYRETKVTVAEDIRINVKAAGYIWIEIKRK